MVKHALSSKIYWIKLLVIYFSWFSEFQIRAETQNNISFSFKKTPLKNVLENIVDEFNLFIIYPDSILENYNVSAECQNCNPNNALEKILKETPLSWKNDGIQYVIFNEEIQTSYNFSGVVLNDKTGEGIPQANIYIPKLFLGTTSDKNGNFSLTHINAKVCTAHVSFIGYNTTIVPMNLPKNKNEKKIVKLIPKIISTEGIKVSGEIREFMETSNTPGRILFSPRHISTLPNLGEVDIFRSLQLLPGIQYGLGGSSDLFVRGSRPEHTLIILDGITMYNNNHLFGFISSINSDIIQNVQIYKSGFPVSYGGRISSLVELTTKVGSNYKTQGIVHSNLLSQGATASLPLFNRGSCIFSFRRSVKNKFQTGLYKSIQKYVTNNNTFDLISKTKNDNQSSTYNPDFKFEDFSGKFSFLISPKNILSITYNIGIDNIKENREFFGFGTILGYDSTFIDESTIFSNNSGIINWTTQWTNNLNTLFSLSNSKNRDQYGVLKKLTNNENIGSYNHQYLFSESSAKFHLRFFSSKRYKLKTGVKYIYRNFELNTKEKDGTSDTRVVLFDQKSQFISFLQYNYVSPSNLFLEGGIRSTKIAENKFYFEPRFLINTKLSENLSIEISLGKYFQFMHKYNNYNSNRGLEQMWIPSGNNLPPIESTNFYFSIINNFPIYSFRSEIYAQKLNSLFIIQLSNNDQLQSPKLFENNFIISNSGEGYIWGLELLVRKTKGKITGWASYQRNRTINWYSDLNENKEFFADHDRTNEFKLVAMTTIYSFQISANWAYTSGRVYTNEENVNISSLDFDIYIPTKQNEERLNPTHHLDISLSKNWNWKDQKTISLGLSIYNIYNKNNISHTRINPFSTSNKITTVSMLGITPTLSIKIFF